MGDDKKLYTTAEIMLATGYPRGTVTSRMKKLGFPRTGDGYTEEQVSKMVLTPLELHRKSEANAIELREKLNARMEREGIPIRIAPNGKGKWGVEIYDD